MPQVPCLEIPPRTKVCGPRARPSSHSSSISSPLLAHTLPQASKLLTVVMSMKTAFAHLQFRRFRHHRTRWAKSATVSWGLFFFIQGLYPSLLLSLLAVRTDIFTPSFCFARTARLFPVAPRCLRMREEKRVCWRLLSLD